MTNPVIRIKTAVDKDGNYLYKHVLYWCEGCDALHGIAIEGKQANGAGWSFDGNMEKPTFAPSQLSEVGKYKCHTLIRGGTVEFLSDCTHEFAGQKRPMVPLPDWIVKE